MEGKTPTPHNSPREDPEDNAPAHHIIPTTDDEAAGAIVPVAAAVAPEEPPPAAFVEDAAARIDAIEARMNKMEAFMQESLNYSTFRGKDLRNQLAVIEDLVRSQRDLIVRDSGDIWDQMPPRLGSRQASPSPPPPMLRLGG